MNSKELNTFNSFIRSNNTFLNDLNSLTVPKPDIYIKIEFLILFLKANYHYNQVLIGPQIILIELIKGHYYIEDNFVIIGNNRYSFEELIHIIKEINIPKLQEPQITELIPKQNFNTTAKKSHCQIIDIGNVYRLNDYTFKERGIIFERNCRVDSITIPYIKEMNRRFIELINRLFNDIVNNTIDIDDDIYYKVLATFIKMYPFLGYAKIKGEEIHFEELKLPLNEIGLTKVKYNDSYLEGIKMRIKDLNNHAKRILHDTELLMNQGIITNRRILDQRQQKVINLNSDIASLIVEYNEYSHNPEVLNCILFDYIFEALSKGNVIINEYFLDPVLKFFTIQNKEVTSYIAIHLNTLLRLIDPSILIGTDYKRLELKNSQ